MLSEVSSHEGECEAVDFGLRFSRSVRFSDFFSESVALVRDVATYLEEDGRLESRSLSRMAALAYATESMFLSKRLAYVTSWLLLHRDMVEGRITPESARSKKPEGPREDGKTFPRDEDVYKELPERFRNLISRSLNLSNRIMILDSMLHVENPGDMQKDPNPVQTQISRVNSILQAHL